MRYRRSKSVVKTVTRVYTYHYWRLQMEIEMGEEEWVRKVAELCAVSYRKVPRRESWEVVVAGSKALYILKLIRPYLLGLKAKSADIIFGLGANLPGNLPRPILPVLKRKK